MDANRRWLARTDLATCFEAKLPCLNIVKVGKENLEMIEMRGTEKLQNGQCRQQ